MSDAFDPYADWLGIVLSDQPPNHYQLLGLSTFESDVESIRSHFDQRFALVRAYEVSAYSDEAIRILAELAQARECLRNPDTKATYDKLLRQTAALAKSSAESNRGNRILTTPSTAEGPYVAGSAGDTSETLHEAQSAERTRTDIPHARIIPTPSDRMPSHVVPKMAIECPHCLSRIWVAFNACGKQLPCPKRNCRRTMLVPAAPDSMPHIDDGPFTTVDDRQDVDGLVPIPTPQEPRANDAFTTDEAYSEPRKETPRTLKSLRPKSLSTSFSEPMADRRLIALCAGAVGATLLLLAILIGASGAPESELPPEDEASAESSLSTSVQEDSAVAPLESQAIKGQNAAPAAAQAVNEPLVSDPPIPAPGYRRVSSDPNDFRVRWTPGELHPDWPNVVSGAEEGEWVAAPGYDRVSQDPNDLRVKWSPGKADPNNPHLVADDEEITWLPAPGYKWVNKDDKKDFRVRWAPGTEHRANHRLIADESEGEWRAAPGYTWNRDTVVWTPEMEHPDHPHVIATTEEGRWTRAPGYRWLNPDGKNDLRVYPVDRLRFTCPPMTPAQHARLLDYFGIELGVMREGRNEIEYAANLSGRPTRRTGARDQENRLGRVSLGEGRLVDLLLLASANVNTNGTTFIVRFIPLEMEKLLLALEQTALGDHDVGDIASTEFGVRAKGAGFEFYVIEQTYHPALKPIIITSIGELTARDTATGSITLQAWDGAKVISVPADAKITQNGAPKALTDLKMRDKLTVVYAYDVRTRKRTAQSIVVSDPNVARVGPQDNVVPPWERWIAYPSADLNQFARILDFFNIELGVAGGGRNEVEYAANFSGTPKTRTGPPNEEKRLYLTWTRGGAVHSANMQLLANAGIDTVGAVVLQFIPADTESLLLAVERAAVSDRSLSDVTSTTFGVRPKGAGFEFYVIGQTYRAEE